MSRATFLWHDYETFGTHPALDRPAQFAALRTDGDLKVVGEPLSVFCRPADDVLPHPGACLVTGITPQRAALEGVCEADFARAIQADMMEPGTCGVGYNSLRFDDEFTRHLFYRNFLDPYEREYKNGNSRFDLIGLVRMCYALRPQGITWPEHEAGVPSFRLEDLTAANGIDHEGAHDALADVRATLELARRVRRAQPRLWQWALSLRDQKSVIRMLDTHDPQPLVHTSARIPASRGCTSLVLPLCGVPDRPKSVVVFDLMADPGSLLDNDADAIADRVFTPTADLPEDVERIPLKAVHSNKVPMLAPLGVLQDADTDRIALDPERCARHAAQLRPHLRELRTKLMSVFAPLPPQPVQDPDLQLYAGGFFSASDKAAMRRVADTPPEKLGTTAWSFTDSRLPEMLFRYRARNWPETLSTDESTRWERYRRERLLAPDGSFTVADFRQELAQARHENADAPRSLEILDALEAWLLDLRIQDA